jgi:hypothetical protein
MKSQIMGQPSQRGYARGGGGLLLSCPPPADLARQPAAGTEGHAGVRVRPHSASTRLCHFDLEKIGGRDTNKVIRSSAGSMLR